MGLEDAIHRVSAPREWRLDLPDYLQGVDLAVVGVEREDLRHTLHRCRNGGSLRVYEIGNPSNETIVLQPPYGVTYLLVAKLARLLSARFHVLSWESQGCPDMSTPLSETELALSYQATCMRDILTRACIRRFHFVGWCQAAQLSVQLISELEMVPRSVTWIAPAGLGGAVVKSEFDRCALPIYREIAERDLAHAATLSTILDKYRNEPLNAGIVGEKLTMLHLAEPASTLRFARYIKLFEDNISATREQLPVALAAQPVLCLHCKNDTFSHYSESVQLAKRSSNVRLQLMDQGGHLQVFDQPQVAAALIEEFINSVP